MSVLAFDIRRRFKGGVEVRAALELPLDPAPVVVLFGPSGAGKTTLLRCLAGLDRPERGCIRFGEEVWADGPAHPFVPAQRRGIGFLFQDYALFPHLTAGENVGYGLRACGRGERDARVREMARLLRIEGLLDRRPDRLSGGERQRVALARALAPRPRLLLLDEPLSALDGPTREELRGELRALLQRAAIPSVVVTHDRVEALALGDTMVVIAEGSVRQLGNVHEVFSSPADLVVARVVGTENVAPARLAQRQAGLVLVEVGASRLWALDPGHLAGEAYACIRAEDVVLEAEPPLLTSARNALPATVVAAVEEGPLVRVALECGFRLVSLVTRESVARLGLTPGRRVSALVKASAIRIVPRSSAAPG